MLPLVSNGPRPLSKSNFLRGDQCPKALFLAVNEPSAVAPSDAESRARRETGRRVGRLAQGLFPDGEAATLSAAPDLDAAEARTRALVAAGTPAIFEAVFHTPDGRRCVVDILAKGRRGWRLIEVKSSASVKPEHLPDAAYQLDLVRACGVPVESVEILHLNSEYVRRGDLDLSTLFLSTPVMAEAEELAPGMASRAIELQRMLQTGREPDVPIGPHCRKPRDCDCIDHCWQDVPQGSVLEIAYLPWEKKFSLFHRGIVRIDDVPGAVDLPERSRRHVEAHQAGRPIIDRAALRTFLNGLIYPVYLLDFETVAPAIPLWDSSRPYQQIPFLFSLHILDRAGAEPEHVDFLAEPGPDPRPRLVEALLEATGKEGSILAYHMPFESTVMKRLAADLPDRADAIAARLPRMADLIVPFRSWQFWLPAMGGSFSIKSVAPAVAPDLTYDDLQVADGATASLTYEAMIAGSLHADEEAQRKALRDYCERDTLAMVRVLEAIRREAAGP
jgi:hypothetical protein